MSSGPAVSVVLPYRNAEDTLEEALSSLLAQRFESFEVVAVDDDSADGGPALVSEVARRDGRIRALTHEGRGLVPALNLGMAASRGSLIARMDADDVAHPDRLGAQVEFLAANPAVGIVGTLVEATPRERVGPGLARYVAWQNSLVTPEDHAREIFIESPLCHPSVLMRRELLLAVGGYRDVPWPEDYDLWLRLDAMGVAMAKVPRVLLSWRHREGRATFSHARYERARFFAAKAEFLARRIARLGRPLWVWGAGPIGKRTARALEAHGVRAAAFVDIDPLKIGRTARGAPIVGKDAIRHGDATILAAVGSLGARARIREILGARGFIECVDYLCAA